MHPKPRIDAALRAPYNGGSNLVISEYPAKVVVAPHSLPVHSGRKRFPGEIQNSAISFKESKQQ
jgi:hypothetical protein